MSAVDSWRKTGSWLRRSAATPAVVVPVAVEIAAGVELQRALPVRVRTRTRGLALSRKKGDRDRDELASEVLVVLLHPVLT